MSDYSLGDHALQLYQQVHHQPPAENTQKAILRTITNNGLEKRCPDWLLELFKAITANNDFADHNLTPEQYCEGNYDITNFWVELSMIADFPIHHDGEHMVIAFDALGRSVCFDFEAYQGGVDIRLMRWPKGTGPHFDRWPIGHRLHPQTAAE